MAELRAYNPTLRDRIASFFVGDERPSPEKSRLIESFFGSRGLGNTGMGLVDLTPAGVPLWTQEFKRAQTPTEAIAAALNFIPGAKGATQGAKSVAYKTIQEALGSGEYLVRGARDGDFRFGKEGGLWATDSPELAKTFGERLELVPAPQNMLQDDASTIAQRLGYDDDVHAGELTETDWANLREQLRSEGYDAVDMGSGHMDGARDIWFLSGDVPRFPNPESGGAFNVRGPNGQMMFRSPTSRQEAIEAIANFERGSGKPGAFTLVDSE